MYVLDLLWALDHTRQTSHKTQRCLFFISALNSVSFNAYTYKFRGLPPSTSKCTTATAIECSQSSFILLLFKRLKIRVIVWTWCKVCRGCWLKKFRKVFDHSACQFAICLHILDAFLAFSFTHPIRELLVVVPSVSFSIVKEYHTLHIHFRGT